MKTLPLLALVALTPFSTAHADVPVPEADPEAVAALARMNARLSHARTMTFTVTLTSTGPEPEPPLTITGRCEKPNRLALRFYRHGEIAEAYSDGHVQSLYDPRARRYLRHTLGYGPNLTDLVWGFVSAIPKGQTSAMATMCLPTGLFGGDAPDLLRSLSQVNAYLAFFQDKDPLDPPEPLPPPPAQPSSSFPWRTVTGAFAFVARYTSCTDEALDGRAVLHLRGHNVPVPVPGERQAPPAGGGIGDLGSIEWYLDATTWLPRRWTETHTWSVLGYRSPTTPPTATSEEDYTAMQVGATPLPPDTFAWTPSPGVRLIHLEKIPPPFP